MAKFVWLLLLLCSLPLSAEKKPLLRKIFSSGALSEKLFLETITKLNSFERFEFTEAYKNENTQAYFSGKGRTACWLKRHDEDELADQLALEIADFKEPVFRYANWVGYCLAGDTEDLATKVRLILIGAGEWRE